MAVSSHILPVSPLHHGRMVRLHVKAPLPCNLISQLYLTTALWRTFSRSRPVTSPSPALWTDSQVLVAGPDSQALMAGQQCRQIPSHLWLGQP